MIDFRTYLMLKEEGEEETKKEKKEDISDDPEENAEINKLSAIMNISDITDKDKLKQIVRDSKYDTLFSEEKVEIDKTVMTKIVNVLPLKSMYLIQFIFALTVDDENYNLTLKYTKHGSNTIKTNDFDDMIDKMKYFIDRPSKCFSCNQ